MEKLSLHIRQLQNGQPAFVVTLATKYFLLGVVMIYTGNTYTNITDKSSLLYKFSTTRLFDVVPMLVVVFIITIIITLFILNFTVFGRKICAVGGNITTAKFAGIKCDKTVVIAYIIYRLCPIENRTR